MATEGPRRALEDQVTTGVLMEKMRPAGVPPARYASRAR